MGFKIQLVLFALSACLFKLSYSACCSNVALQPVRLGYPRYEGCGCSSYQPLAGSCGCGCFRTSGPSSLTSCGSSGCGCSSSDSSVCSCFKKLNCGSDCGPQVYFPEVEYPVTVIDALGPFYYSSCVC